MGAYGDFFRTLVFSSFSFSVIFPNPFILYFFSWVGFCTPILSPPPPLLQASNLYQTYHSSCCIHCKHNMPHRTSDIRLYTQSWWTRRPIVKVAMGCRTEPATIHIAHVLQRLHLFQFFNFFLFTRLTAKNITLPYRKKNYTTKRFFCPRVTFFTCWGCPTSASASHAEALRDLWIFGEQWAECKAKKFPLPEPCRNTILKHKKKRWGEMGEDVSRFGKLSGKMVINHPPKGGKRWFSVPMGLTGWVY